MFQGTIVPERKGFDVGKPDHFNIRDWRNPMPSIRGIRPCLWFDTEAEQAAKFYTGIFNKSRIVAITHYGKAGFETHHKPAGSC